MSSRSRLAVAPEAITTSSIKQASKMVSVADSTYNMLSRHMAAEELDFPLYPDPTQSMFPQQPFPFNIQSFDMDSTYAFGRPQESYPSTTGFSSSTMYADTAPPFALESPEL